MLVQQVKDIAWLRTRFGYETITQLCLSDDRAMFQPVDFLLLTVVNSDGQI